MSYQSFDQLEKHARTEALARINKEATKINGVRMVQDRRAA